MADLQNDNAEIRAKRRAEQLRKRGRQRLVFLVAAVAAVVLLIALIAILLFQGNGEEQVSQALTPGAEYYFAGSS